MTTNAPDSVVSDTIPPQAQRTRRWPQLPRSTAFVGVSAAMMAFLIAAGAPTPLLPIYERTWAFPAWMLTLAFGVYALGLLAAVLIVGSLSDHIGRRPLIIASLVLQLVAMVLFVTAPSIGWLIVARVVQGVATGGVLSAASAAVVELAPERRKKLGATMSSLAPLGGLGVGALFAGLVAQSVSNAIFVVWLVLLIVFAIGTLFALFVPETVTRKPGAAASLIPRISLPKQVRGLMAASVPGVVSAFMTMALYLALVPVALGAVFAVTSPIVGSVAAFVAFAAGALAALFTTGVGPHQLRVWGSAALAIGGVLFIAAIAADVLWLVWIAAVISGAGIGASFSGTVRGLVPEVAPHQRAALFAAIYLASYLSLGVPAIIAGAFASAVGISPMATWFSVVIVVLAIAGVIVTASHHARRRTTISRL